MRLAALFLAASSAAASSRSARRSAAALDAPPPPPPPCPPELLRIAERDGRFSVAQFGALGQQHCHANCTVGKTGDKCRQTICQDDAVGVREAIAMSLRCGVSEIWFPPPRPAAIGAQYVFNSTVLIDRGPLLLTGDGGASVGFAGSPPQAAITNRGAGPAFLFNYSIVDGVVLRNLNIGGGHIAVKIQGSSGIVFDNCILQANSDGNWTAFGANVRLGSDNAALVVV